MSACFCICIMPTRWVSDQEFKTYWLDQRKCGLKGKVLVVHAHNLMLASSLSKQRGFCIGIPHSLSYKASMYANVRVVVAVCKTSKLLEIVALTIKSKEFDCGCH